MLRVTALCEAPHITSPYTKYITQSGVRDVRFEVRTEIGIAAIFCVLPPRMRGALYWNPRARVARAQHKLRIAHRKPTMHRSVCVCMHEAESEAIKQTHTGAPKHTTGRLVEYL